MSERDRREFLKQSAVAVSALGLGSCRSETNEGQAAQPLPGARALDGTVLNAVGSAVLPSELGPAGQGDAVRAFQDWLAEFEPVTERPHPYLRPEITYGPPDPAPGWNAQLAALDLEARRSAGAAFSDLGIEVRRAMLRRQIDGEDPDFPDPARARHVAVGLLAHFYRSSAANDACYAADIGKNLCRGLDVLDGSPAPRRIASDSRPRARPHAADARSET